MSEYISAVIGLGGERHPNSQHLRRIDDWLYENRKKLKVLSSSENSKGLCWMIISLKEFVKVAKHFEHDADVLELIDNIKNGKWYKCSQCGCLILGSYPFTYRDYGGCVGKSTECSVCCSLSNKDAHAVCEMFNKKGSKAAITLSLSL